MVRNFDKNGKEIKDLSKIVLKRKDFEVLYRLLEDMAAKKNKNNESKLDNNCNS